MSYFCSKDIFKKGTSKEIHQMITGKLPPIDERIYGMVVG